MHSVGIVHNRIADHMTDTILHRGWQANGRGPCALQMCEGTHLTTIRLSFVNKADAIGNVFHVCNCETSPFKAPTTVMNNDYQTPSALSSHDGGSEHCTWQMSTGNSSDSQLKWREAKTGWATKQMVFGSRSSLDNICAQLASYTIALLIT